MIDRTSRRQAAGTLRRYAAGLIEFDECNDSLQALPVDGDLAIKRTQDAAWWLEEDFCPRGEDSIRAERREMALWVLFLLRDEEYIWPTDRKFHFLLLIFMLLSGLIIIEYIRAISDSPSPTLMEKIERWRARQLGGDLDLWPFFNQQQLARASVGNPFG
ncbi:hypothetical protein KQI84_09770 [bacterium]|nr:hypothetical protein [bacterium]